MKKLLQTRIEFPLFIRVSLQRIDGIEGKAGRFFTPPFSVWAAVVLAFIFGALSPLHLRLLDYKRFEAAWGYDYAAVPWYPFIFAIVVLAFLHLRSAPLHLPTKPNQILGIVLATLLLCGSLAISYFGCRIQDHVCMGGHLDNHFEEPSFLIGEYLSDSGWASGLIIAVVALGRCRSPITLASATIAGFLISFRFLFGSFGGVYPFF